MNPRLLLLLLLAPAAFGTVIVVERDGAPVAQAEVCRFAAGDRENPFRRWFAWKDVTCMAAGAEVELPRGLWNVFARAGGNALSAPVLVDGAATPPRLTLTLGAAATVVPLLPEKRRGVIYVPRRGSAFAVDAERVLVPADEELWLFVLEKSVPVAVFSVAPLKAGTEQTVDGRTDGPAAVIGWMQIAQDERVALSETTGIVSPGVRAFSGVARRESDLLPPLSQLNGAFVRVRDVPPGNAELRIEGRGWLPDRRAVKVSATPITIAPDPLRVSAAATLIVHWSTQQDLPALDRSVGACDESDRNPQVVLTVSKCAAMPPPRPGTPSGPPPDDPPCSAVREESFDPAPMFGSMTLEDIPPGAYRAEMRLGKLPPVRGMTAILPLQPKDLRLQASYVEGDGSVTLGGKPIGEDVRIQFPAGIGFAPRESEEYHAQHRGPVDIDTKIIVAACDGEPRALVLADEPMRPRSRYNIDIPDNELTLNITDTFTREALPGATVKIDVMSFRRPPRVVLQETLKADEMGVVVKKAVPLRELRIAVTHAGYEKQQLETFSMTKSENKSIDVRLVPLRGNKGKILSERAFDSGAVYWFAPDGRETERTDLAPDGTFFYNGWHAPEETMAVVTLSHPLWVLHSPEIGRRDTISIRFPNGVARAFDVTLTAADRRTPWTAGLVIGGLRVPPLVLASHQSLRREQVTLRAGGVVHFRDVLETGPIEVTLGEMVQRLVPGATQIAFDVQ